MNAPHPLVGTAKPLRDVSVAVPTTPSKMKCLGCQGEGEVEWLALDDDRIRWEACDDCDGTGIAKKPYCECCEGKLTADGFCYGCDDYAEGFAPTGWEAAERSVFGMAVKS